MPKAIISTTETNKPAAKIAESTRRKSNAAPPDAGRKFYQPWQASPPRHSTASTSALARYAVGHGPLPALDRLPRPGAVYCNQCFSTRTATA